MGHVPGAGAGPVPGGRPPGVRRDPVRHVPPQPPHHDGRHGPHHHLDTSPPRLPALPGKYGYVTIYLAPNYTYMQFILLVNI